MGWILFFFDIGPLVTNEVAGPFFIKASQAFTAGSKAAQDYTAGSKASQSA